KKGVITDSNTTTSDTKKPAMEARAGLKG
ncbi:hypothetical protein MED92_15710 [Oceanospirillum sp. MED92]|nr:hypothetical protein MED92_15710 [Oceanospirillum sp. MED92] [Neptuniibacter caesariensis]